MKTLHDGTSEFAHVRTEMIAYSWKFEDAGDHEHPYILTVTVDGESLSEGFEHDVGHDEAAARAESLAGEIYAARHKD